MSKKKQKETESGYYIRDTPYGKLRRVSSFDVPFLPCDGVWLVQRRKGCISHDCILKIGELPTLMPFAALIRNKEALSKKILELWKQTICANDFASELMKWMVSYDPKKDSGYAD